MISTLVLDLISEVHAKIRALKGSLIRIKKYRKGDLAFHRGVPNC
jgi:hypothetical protein